MNTDKINSNYYNSLKEWENRKGSKKEAQQKMISLTNNQMLTKKNLLFSRS